MRYIIGLITILVSLSCITQAQTLKEYEYLGSVGTYVNHGQLNHTGEYIEVVNSDRDTLTVWKEHVTPDREPTWGAAKRADKVVWCYPQEYPSAKHMFSNAEGRLFYWKHDDRIFFATKDAKTKHMQAIE